MEDSTSVRSRIVHDVAARHGVSVDAVETLLHAIAAGGGTMAQFNHPDLGGMGQWTRGGMMMIGDMFNQGLKYRVDSLCADLSDLLQREPALAPRSVAFGSAGWWPEEFGTPSSSGAQNDLRYAFFPGTRRLAISRAGETSVYDTGEHMISGVSQQQGGDQSLSFTSQFGTVRLHDLQRLHGHANTYAEPERSSDTAAPADVNFAAPELPTPVPQTAVTPPAAAAPETASRVSQDAGADDVFAKLERLAALRDKGIVTEAEFATKKAELLSRI